jgi:hypothetical protein
LRSKEDLWKKGEQIPWIREQLRGSAPLYGRLTHDALITVGMVVWGPDDPSVGARITAAAGSLSLPILFLLARRLYGTRAALYATLVFSLLGYHIHYSRSTMAETTTLLFLLLAFYFYAGSRTINQHLSTGSLAWAGLFLGVSFTAHNRMLIMWGIFLLYEMQLWIQRHPYRPMPVLKRLLVFQLFFLLPLATWEFAYYLALMISKHLEIVPSVPTYVEQVFLSVTRSALWGYISKIYRLEGFYAFPYLYLKSSGPLPLLLTLTGIIVACKRRAFQDILVGIWFFIPYLVYSVTTAGLSRIFTVVLPATALLSGSLFAPNSKALLVSRHSSGSTSSFIKILVIVLILCNGLYFGYQEIRSKDGYAQAANYLRSQGSPHIISTGVPILGVYIGENQVAQHPPVSQEELKRLFDQDYLFYLIDYNKYIYTFSQKDKVEIMGAIASRIPPDRIIPNPFVREPLTAFEANLFFWDTLDMLKKIPEQGLDTIQIYDLRNFFSFDSRSP